MTSPTSVVSGIGALSLRLAFRARPPRRRAPRHAPRFGEAGEVEPAAYFADPSGRSRRRGPSHAARSGGRV